MRVLGRWRKSVSKILTRSAELPVGLFASTYVRWVLQTSVVVISHLVVVYRKRCLHAYGRPGWDSLWRICGSVWRPVVNQRSSIRSSIRGDIVPRPRNMAVGKKKVPMDRNVFHGVLWCTWKSSVAVVMTKSSWEGWFCNGDLVLSGGQHLEHVWCTMSNRKKTSTVWVIICDLIRIPTRDSCQNGGSPGRR